MPAEAIVKGDAKVRRSRPRRSWPRCTATACARRCTRAHPQYGFDGAQGLSHAEHLAALQRHGACAQHRRSFRAGARGAARDGRLSGTVAVRVERHRPRATTRCWCACASSLHDPAAYRKLGEVWLEGEHLCAALRAARRRARAQARDHRSRAGRTPALRDLAGQAAQVAVVPDALDGRLERARIAGAASASSLRVAGAGAAAIAGAATRRARPRAGRRQRRQHPAQRRGVRLRPGGRAQGHARRCGRPRCCAPAWARTSRCGWWRALQAS